MSGLGVINSAQKPIFGGMPPKRGRGRPAANKVIKPTPKTSASTRRATDRVATAIEKETGRKALTEKKSNNPKSTAATRGRRGAAVKDVDMEDVSTLAPPGSDEVTRPKGRGRPKKVIKETAASEVQQPTRGMRQSPEEAGRLPSWTLPNGQRLTRRLRLLRKSPRFRRPNNRTT